MPQSNKLVIFLAMLLANLTITASLKLYSRNEAFDWYNLPDVKAADFKPFTIEQDIDHFDTTGERNLGKFKQRYWINDKYVKPSDPNDPIKHGDLVWLGVCGESSCHHKDGSMVEHQIGAHYNALLVSIEHRYYGDSHPFKDLQTQNMEFLTSDQALEDIKNFLSQLYQRRPFKKVLLVGCSYAGGLVGWFAENNSKFVDDQNGVKREYQVAAWASSGVMRPLEEFWGFDEAIYQQMIKSGTECVQLAQTLTGEAEQILTANGTERAEVLKALKANPTAKNGDILFYIADAFAITVQYGNRTGLCNLLEEIKDKPFMEKLELFKNGTNKSVKMKDYDRSQMLTNMSTATNNSMRQWNYQFCNEFGWFQTPSVISETHQIRSQMLGNEYWSELCQDLFGKQTYDRRKENALKIGQKNRNGKVLYVNAIEDPWLGVSVLPKNKPDQLWFLDRLGGPKFIEQGLDGPIKDEVGANSIIIHCQDCSHCQDLSRPEKDDSQGLRDGRVEIGNWLEDFVKSDIQVTQNN